MPVSKHRKNHKAKLAVRKKATVAKRKEIDKLVAQLGNEFGKLEAPASQPEPVYSPVVGGGTYLTPTPDENEIMMHYDKMEI
jgi:hypothetical protein